MANSAYPAAHSVVSTIQYILMDHFEGITRLTTESGPYAAEVSN